MISQLPKIMIALPAFNEALILERSVETLLAFGRANLKNYDFRILIVDNASTDRTAAIGRSLAEKNREIGYLFIAQKGKGAAIKAAWLADQADVYVFMDVDLATDLSALPLLIKTALQNRGVAIGSRFLPSSKAKRIFLRQVLSWGYRLIFKALLQTKVGDLACGFKAISDDVKNAILSQTRESGFFFDSELVILAERAGFKVEEVPVIWVEARDRNRKSTVNVLGTIKKYLKGVLMMRRRLK